MTSQARMSILVAALFLGVGCGSEIDYDDELGLEPTSSPSSDYELVVIGDGEKEGGANTQSDESGMGEEGEEEPLDSGDETSDLIAYDDTGEFTVQVGLYDSSRKAGKRVTELSALGYPAYAIAIPSGNQFRVRIGYFESRKMAKRFGEIFKQDIGVEYWIDRRSNEMY